MSSKQQTSEDSTDFQTTSEIMLAISAAELKPLGHEDKFDRSFPSLTWSLADDIQEKFLIKDVSRVERYGEGPAIVVKQPHLVEVDGQGFIATTKVKTWPEHEGEQKWEAEVEKVIPATYDEMQKHDLV